MSTSLPSQENRRAGAGARLGDRLCVLGAALLFSTGGAAIKWATLDGWQVAALRSAFALAAIAALVPGPISLRVRGSLRIGLANGATMLMFVLSNKLTTAVNAIFLQSTGPLYLPLLGPALIGERAHRSDWWAMLVVGVGMLLFFVGAPASYATAPSPRLGDALAIGSGLGWALTVLGYRWAGRAGQGSSDAGAAKAAMLWGNLVVVVAALPMALPLGDVGIGDWSVVAYLGVFQIALAYRLLALGLRRVPAMEAALLGFLEPVLSPLWAWLLHGEVPSAWAVAGASLIAAVALSRAIPRTSP